MLADPCTPGDPGDNPPGTVPVQPPPLCGDEERAFGPLADGQVDRAGCAWRERDGDDLAALAGDDQGAVAAFQAQVLDVRAGRLGYPQPVQREQRDEGVPGGRPEPGATRMAPSSLRSRAVACDS
jgi:hypothetical protein